MQIDSYIVDKEIKRRELYLTMLDDLVDLLKSTDLKIMYIKQIPLRYFYNKIAEITYKNIKNNSDPLFIKGKFELSTKQIHDDLEYSKIKNIDPNSIIELIESYVNTANEELPKLKYEIIIPRKQKNKLIVKDLYVNDFRNLSGINIEYAFALGLRYQYIALENHNLARLYKKHGFEKDCCLEGFATAYNHYFDSFCSPFIDLEFVFGSIGSFFSIKEWPLKYIHVNPPFDSELMSLAIFKVLKSLETLEDGYTFDFILPDWMDLNSFNVLVNSKFVVYKKIHNKGEFEFVDYHKNPNKYIYPCNILQVILKS